MPLTNNQRKALAAEARANGVDPADVIAEAERMSGAPGPSGRHEAPDDEPPKLFMYHLPFVRVREVRQRWLGLTESFPGDDEIAAKWAAKFVGGTTPPDEEPPT